MSDVRQFRKYFSECVPHVPPLRALLLLFRPPTSLAAAVVYILANSCSHCNRILSICDCFSPSHTPASPPRAPFPPRTSAPPLPPGPSREGLGVLSTGALNKFGAPLAQAPPPRPLPAPPPAPALLKDGLPAFHAPAPTPSPAPPAASTVFELPPWVGPPRPTACSHELTLPGAFGKPPLPPPTPPPDRAAAPLAADEFGREAAAAGAPVALHGMQL